MSATSAERAWMGIDTSGIGAEITTCQPSMPGRSTDARPSESWAAIGGEVEDLAGQGAGVERPLGLGDEGARGIHQVEGPAGRLDCGRRGGEQGRHGQRRDERARALALLMGRLDDQDLGLRLFRVHRREAGDDDARWHCVEVDLGPVTRLLALARRRATPRSRLSPAAR